MEQIGEILRRMFEGANQCIFCGGVPVYQGAFFPTDSGEWGAARGKQRVFFYGICEKCFSEIDPESRAERAEKIFAHSVRAASAPPAGAQKH